MYEPLLKKEKKRKNTFDSLQLSVIRQQLSPGKTNKMATCCLCCVDLVDSLPRKERIFKLTAGYIRKHCKYEFSPDLVQLCITYVGTENAWSWRQLDSIKQQKKDKCCEYCGNIISFIFYSLWILCIFGIYFGKDIAALVINSLNNCDDALDGGSKYVNFGVSTWIWSGCITHLSGIGIIILVGLLTICDVNCFEWMDDCCDDMFDWDEDEGSKCCFTVLCGGPCCFAFCWLIIGFLLYSEMSRDSDTNLECSNVVLSWSILQIVESLISTGATCCFVIMDWDSD
eukprot:350697_1